MTLLLYTAIAVPAVSKEDASPTSRTIAPVEDTGDFADLLDSPADTVVPIPSRLPTKDETATQINIYKSQPLTLAHGVENVLEGFGLGQYTNFILDCLCLLAYGYLLRLTSKSSHYFMELIQILGFFLFPALPLVQLANNALRTLLNVMHDGSPGLNHTLSCVTGHYATSLQPVTAPLSPLNEKADTASSLSTSGADLILIRQRLTHIPPHELESASTPRLSMLRRLIGIALSVLTIIASITTLHIHLDHPVRSDWDSVGIASDQRHGWLSSSATLTSILSVTALAVNKVWSIKPEFTRPETRSGVFGETEVFAELALAAIVQDLVAGFSGADSFAGYLAYATANRWGLLVLLVIVAVLNKRLLSVAQALFGGRAKGRRNSGQLSRGLIVVMAVGVCVLVGGYHVLGQVMATRLAAKNRIPGVGTGTASRSGSLSGALSGVE
ncbi:MAG: hypothetical protein Q9162_002401 [Coniocarpon cinnabarinum]